MARRLCASASARKATKCSAQRQCRLDLGGGAGQVRTLVAETDQDPDHEEGVAGGAVTVDDQVGRKGQTESEHHAVQRPDRPAAAHDAESFAIDGVVDALPARPVTAEQPVLQAEYPQLLPLSEAGTDVKEVQTGAPLFCGALLHRADPSFCPAVPPCDGQGSKGGDGERRGDESEQRGANEERREPEHDLGHQSANHREGRLAGAHELDSV